MTIPLHHVVKFADDCTLLIPLFRAAMDNSAAEFQQILDWCMQNGMSVNFSKTKEVYCTFRSSSWRAPNVFNIEQVSCVKMLGYRFHENLKHDDHINKVVKVCQQYIFLLRKLKYMGVFQRELHILFVAWITSRTTYCSNIFARTSQQNVDAVERIYKRANKLGISYSSSFSGICSARDETVFRSIFTRDTHPLHKLLQPLQQRARRSCRSKYNWSFRVPFVRTTTYKNMFFNRMQRYVLQPP